MDDPSFSYTVDTIPIVGSSGLLSSYRDALGFLANAPTLIQQGYDEHHGHQGVFRVARLFRWEYVVCGPKLVKEVGAAPDHVLSFHAGVQEVFQLRHVIGAAISDNPYHQHTIRTSLTRNLHTCFPEVRDEIICAFNDVLQVQSSDWKTLPVLPTMMAVVARVSNRIFVGLPLCRNKTYLQNNVQFAIDVFRSGQRIALFPAFLRPLVARLITSKNKSFATAVKLLGPTIEERLLKEREMGPDWPGKSNDLISWLLDTAEGEERTVPALVLRVLAINFAAIHTSSMAFTHALFDLATHPEYLRPMREEVELVVKKEGWSKAALNNMVKVDSFLRESQRLNNGAASVMHRKVVAKEGFSFSDGTILAYLQAANFDHPTKFDGFRFAQERANHMAQHERDPLASQDIFKRQMISTAVDHLPFGTGKHACPGRFFAATELKAMMAHLVVNYDIRAEVEGVRPLDAVFGTRITPNPAGKVYFRKRMD
ncbi:cytochrome P450 [Mycena metata]|uniref:Cytochrome P450 n=1 Tax=Mycena metata TaxID=1033252 RepID=A0AAD7NMI4_9AGAR|nr:cytochrome P450 [Mycena metata]